MQETWVLSVGQEDPLEEAWQPTLVSLPGESHGQRSLVGYSPWGRRVGHNWSDFTHLLSEFFSLLSCVIFLIALSSFRKAVLQFQPVYVEHIFFIYEDVILLLKLFFLQ